MSDGIVASVVGSNPLSCNVCWVQGGRVDVFVACFKNLVPKKVQIMNLFACQ